MLLPYDQYDIRDWVEVAIEAYLKAGGYGMPQIHQPTLQGVLLEVEGAWRLRGLNIVPADRDVDRSYYSG